MVNTVRVCLVDWQWKKLVNHRLTSLIFSSLQCWSFGSVPNADTPKDKLYLCTGGKKRTYSLTPQPVISHLNRRATHQLHVQSVPLPQISSPQHHMCYSLPKPTLLWPVTSGHRLADTGCLFFFFLHFAHLCPPPSHTISSCQISPVTLGQVPACLVQLSVSKRRQLLGKVTLLLGSANAVARELGVLSSSSKLFALLLFTHLNV